MTTDPVDTTDEKTIQLPVSQGRPVGGNYSSGKFRLWKQMPRVRFNLPDPNFQLLPEDRLEELLAECDPPVAERIKEDVQHLEYELLRLFRERDYQAALNKNRYQLYQIIFIGLAALATFLGSMLALSLGDLGFGDPALWSLAETIVAVTTTFFATLSGQNPPMQVWLENRRRAEYLRREYFRYLGNLAPYDLVSGYERKMLLSRRAADINRGTSVRDDDTTVGAAPSAKNGES